MNQLSVSARTVLIDLNTVRATRGISTRKVNALVESGALLWVFNMGRMNTEKPILELRFWLPEIIDAEAVIHLKISEVIQKILPESRQKISGSEIGQWFLVSRPTVQRIGLETGGVVKDRILHVKRPALEDYLRKRWLGAGSVSGKVLPA